MIEILERYGLDSFKRVGLWDEDQGWVEGEERLDFPNSEHYDEDMMMEHFDGPTVFAAPEGSVEKNSQSIGPTQSTLLGVGDDVTVVDTEGSDDDEDEEDEEVYR